MTPLELAIQYLVATGLVVARLRTSAGWPLVEVRVEGGRR